MAKPLRYKYSSKRNEKCEAGNIAYNQVSEAEESNIVYRKQKKKPQNKSKFIPEGNRQAQHESSIGNAVQKSKRGSIRVWARTRASTRLIST